jgi:hypothetical protein
MPSLCYFVDALFSNVCRVVIGVVVVVVVGVPSPPPIVVVVVVVTSSPVSS